MRRRFIAIPIAVAAALLLTASIGVAGDIHAMQPWSRATPPGTSVGVGYVMLHNTGAQPRVLVGATSPAAAKVEMHETRQGTNGLSQMRPIERLTVPAGGAVTFEPGGRHLMLVGLKAPLTAGQRVPLTLQFEGAEPVTIELDVRPLTQTDAPPTDHEQHHH